MILTTDRFRRMAWANGKGMTVEMLRLDGPDGILLRLSRASVIEEGDFSLFQGVERNLTVLTGPGFDLEGPGISLQARPFVPVAFPGDVPLRAVRVSAPSDDFNVMTARSLPKPSVQLLYSGDELRGPHVFAYALASSIVSGREMIPDSLFICKTCLTMNAGGPVLAVAVAGLPDAAFR